MYRFKIPQKEGSSFSPGDSAVSIVKSSDTESISASVVPLSDLPVQPLISRVLKQNSLPMHYRESPSQHSLSLYQLNKAMW